MATMLYGAPLCEAICKDCAQRSQALKEKNVLPTLGIFRVGKNPAAAGYETSIHRRAEACGVTVRTVEISAEAGEAEICRSLSELCGDASVHGILLSMPLPKEYRHLTVKLCEMIPVEKDVDGASPRSLGCLYAGMPAFGACTAEACVRLAKFYGVELKGKNVAVIGRSVVVGKPLAAMLIAENATVTVCHRSTVDTERICREADVIFSAAGNAGLVTAEYVREGSAVLDVGANWDEAKQCLVGDVVIDAVKEIAAAVSPVPGGVGVVTSAALMDHVLTAAESALR